MTNLLSYQITLDPRNSPLHGSPVVRCTFRLITIPVNLLHLLVPASSNIHVAMCRQPARSSWTLFWPMGDSDCRFLAPIHVEWNKHFYWGDLLVLLSCFFAPFQPSVAHVAGQLRWQHCCLLEWQSNSSPPSPRSSRGSSKLATLYLPLATLPSLVGLVKLWSINAAQGCQREPVVVGFPRFQVSSLHKTRKVAGRRAAFFRSAAVQMEWFLINFNWLWVFSANSGAAIVSGKGKGGENGVWGQDFWEPSGTKNWWHWRELLGESGEDTF